MEQVLTAITQVGVLTFVVAGMLGLGLALTPTQIITPLRDTRLVVTALLANFVVVPAVAILAARLLPMDDASGAAVVLLGCCAGAPFLPTLAKLAHGDAALAVGVMVLLMVLTVVYAPVVVPIAVEGSTVSAGDIAGSLIVYMLLPLAAGLVARARYPDLATSLVGGVQRASTAGLVIGMVAGLLVTWREVWGSIGSWIFVGTAIVVIAGLAAGGLPPGARSAGDRLVLALGTAQRNISAALVISVSLGGTVVVRTLVAALVLPIALIVLAGEIGRRTAGREGPASDTAPSGDLA